MKKICLVTDGTMPVPAVKGGAVSTLLQILADQNESEKKVLLYIFSPYDIDAEKLSTEYQYTKFIYEPYDNSKERGLAFITRCLNKVSKIIRKNEIPCYSAFYRKSLKDVKRINPDYIVCEGGPQIAGFACFLKDYDKNMLYVHLHGNWFPSGLVSNIFDHVISISNFVAKEYRSTCSNENVRIKTVYNCIEEDKFSQRLSEKERNLFRNEFGFSKTDFVIVFCGRICADKGVVELIQAVINSTDNIKLLIIGSPNFAVARKSSYLEEVINLVECNSEKIKFTGYIENDKVWKYHQCADCMAVPSMWEEPAGLTVLEGMTSGLPLVVTNSGGIIEEVDEQCAIIVSRENVVFELEMAFKKISLDKDLKIKMAIASEGRSKVFSKKKFYEDFLDCFEEDRS